MAWYHCFILLRMVMGWAGFVCSMFAVSYLPKIGEAYEEATKNNVKKSDPFFFYFEIEWGIMLLPLVMFIRYIGLEHYATQLPRNRARGLRVFVRMIMLLVLSYTMLLSATAVATDYGKEYVLMMLVFVLASVALVEGALLTEENFGVFELTLTFVVVQCLTTYSHKKKYWYCLIFLVYCLREGLMLFMRYVDQRLQGKVGDVAQLIESWNLTNRDLTNQHNIDVDRDLPDFKGMERILHRLKRVARN